MADVRSARFGVYCSGGARMRSTHIFKSAVHAHARSDSQSFALPSTRETGTGGYTATPVVTTGQKQKLLTR